MTGPGGRSPALIQGMNVRQVGERVHLEIAATEGTLLLDLNITNARHFLVALDEALRLAMAERERNRARSASPEPSPTRPPPEVDPKTVN